MAKGVWWPHSSGAQGACLARLPAYVPRHWRMPDPCPTLTPPRPAPPRPAPLRYVMPNVQAAQALSATLAAIFDVLNGALLLS